MEALSPKNVSRDEVLDALNRVLAGNAFATAGRAREFLSFSVRETVAGRGDRLKGYTIAVEVFERPADFDAQADPLVRVEAGRLRRRLAEYYQSDGRDDPIRIELPRGGYAPVFVRNSPDGVRPAEEPALPAPRRRARWVVGGMVGAIGIVLLASLFAVSKWSPRAPGQAIATRGPRLVVLPLANLSEGKDVSFTTGLTDEIIRQLVAFNIFATASPPTQTLERAPLETLRKDFNAGYALSGTVRADGNRVRVSMRLTDTEFGTQLWTWSVDMPADASAPIATQESLGLAVAQVVSSPYGPVFSHEIDRIADKPSAELDPYECLLRFYAYTRGFGRDLHGRLVRCMESAVETAPQFATAWSALGVLYLHEHVFGYDPQLGRKPALDRALDAMRKSLALNPEGRVALVSMASVQLARGDERASTEALERALAQTPTSPATLGQAGWVLMLTGDWQRGKALVEQALPGGVHVPAWYRTALAFEALHDGRYDEALDWAQKADAPNWFVTPMTIAAAAGLAGRHNIAERELKRLLELEPDFARTGSATLQRWGMNAELRALIRDGLHRAGLEDS